MMWIVGQTDNRQFKTGHLAKSPWQEDDTSSLSNFHTHEDFVKKQTHTHKHTHTHHFGTFNDWKEKTTLGTFTNAPI